VTRSRGGCDEGYNSDIDDDALAPLPHKIAAQRLIYPTVPYGTQQRKQSSEQRRR
jgi:hypothetical protein